jgi:hypothetical protein
VDGVVDEVRTPLRHADIRTTVNVCTQAMTEQKQQAHTRIVRLLLKT